MVQRVPLLSVLLALQACATAHHPRETAPPGPQADVRRLVEQLGLGAEERQAARARLLEMGPSVVPGLVRGFDSTSFTIRWETANILGLMRARDGIPALVDRVLHDSDPHIRWRSLWALGRLGDRSVGRLFLPALASGDPDERWQAAIALSRFDMQASLGLLHQGAMGDDTWRSWEAINALGRVGDESSVAVLRTVLERSEAPRERREAVLSLGRLLRLPGAVAHLLFALNDADSGVRLRAARQLGRVAAPGRSEAIARRLAIEPEEAVREELERALRRGAGQDTAPATGEDDDGVSGAAP